MFQVCYSLKYTIIFDDDEDVSGSSLYLLESFHAKRYIKHMIHMFSFYHFDLECKIFSVIKIVIVFWS